MAGNRDAFLPNLAMSLNNLANRQSAIGQREAALATAQEAADLYRELVAGNRDAFAEQFARACGTLAHALKELGRVAEAMPVLAEAIRSILPDVRRYPPAYLGVCVQLIRDYVSNAEAAKVQPDGALIQEVASILEPYLRQKGE